MTFSIPGCDVVAILASGYLHLAFLQLPWHETCTEWRYLVYVADELVFRHSAGN